MATLLFQGFVFDSEGNPVAGATADLIAKNGGLTGTAVETTTTSATGLWTLTRTTAGEYDIRITNGSLVTFLMYDDQVQLNSITLGDDNNISLGDAGDASIDYDGTDMVIDTQVTGSGRLLLNAGQLGFPGTQVASSNVNTLDDYEEGSFTPGIGDDSNDGSGESQTYVVQSGRYTKIGNTVFIAFRVGINSLGSLTTSEGAVITGLPFTANATANTQRAMAIGFGTSLVLPNASENVVALTRINATEILLYLWDATTGTSVLLISQLSSGGEVIGSGHYMV